MNINRQLEDFLAGLGVEMERAEQEHFAEDSLPELSIFQSSRDHYGVFYRLDVVDRLPELRIMVPVDYGEVKLEMYLVRMSKLTSTNAWFSGMAAFRGSPAFERGREAALQHMLYAVAEIMKQLFWSGDLDALQFPPEIQVTPLILGDEKRLNP